MEAATQPNDRIQIFTVLPLPLLVLLPFYILSWLRPLEVFRGHFHLLRGLSGSVLLTMC